MLIDDARNLIIDKFCTFIAIRLGEAVGLTGGVVVGQVGQLLAHTEIGNHSIRLLGYALKVVGSAGRDAAKEKFFGSATTEERAHLVEHSLSGGDLAFLGEIPGSTERLAARHYSNLDERIGILKVPAERSVTRLMDGDRAALIFGDNLGAFFETADDAIHGIHEILALHMGFLATRSDKRSLVAHIGDVGTREAGSLSCEKFEVNTLVHLDFAQVNLENFHTIVQLGELDINLAVETPGAQERLVEDVNAVGGSEDNHATIGAETIHFGEELVERVFALIVRAHIRILAAGTSHSVDFVDKHDARSLLLGLTEEVADARSTHTHKHFDKVGAGEREERHICFAGDSLCEEGFTGSRRSHKEGTFRDSRTEFGVCLRILEELHNLLHLGFSLRKSGNIVESNAIGAVFVEKLRFRLGNAEHTASTTATASAHAVHEENPKDDEEQNRTEAPNPGRNVAACIVFYIADFHTRCFPFFSFLIERIHAWHMGGDRSLRAFFVLLFSENFLCECVGKLGNCLVFIREDGDACNSAFLGIGLKFRPCYLLLDFVTCGHISHEQNTEDKRINPKDVHSFENIERGVIFFLDIAHKNRV